MCINESTRMFLLFQTFANNLIAYKLFKSNLARVLRTSNHILVLAAMIIFGHIFPFLWACHWLFSIMSYVKFLFAHPHFCRKHIYFFYSGFPVPTSRIPLKKLSLCSSIIFFLAVPPLQHPSPIVTEHPLCARCSSFQSSEQLIRDSRQY